MSLRTGLLFLILPFLFSCHKKKTPELRPADNVDTTQGTYFSINQYIDDHKETVLSQPYTFVRLADIDGEKDSTILHVHDMEWGRIISAFQSSDIGAVKFLGHYDVSLLDDDATGNKTYVYQAKEPDLFTRQLHLSFDPVTNRIVSIYIETEKSTSWKTQKQRLLYKPLQWIQLQQDETPRIGSSRKIRIDYRFL